MAGTWSRTEADTVEDGVSLPLRSPRFAPCLLLHSPELLSQECHRPQRAGPPHTIINPENSPRLQASLMEAFSQLMIPLPR